jgi:hypothetical protein
MEGEAPAEPLAVSHISKPGSAGASPFQQSARIVLQRDYRFVAKMSGDGPGASS